MAAGRPTLIFNFLPLRNGLGQKNQRNAAQRNRISQLDGAGSCHSFAIDLCAALGAQIIEHPLIVLATADSGVLTGNAGIIELYICSLSPADDILPMGEGNRGSVGQAQLPPNLRRMGHGQQGTDSSGQNKNSQHREQKTDHSRIPGACQRIGCKQRCDAVQLCLQESFDVVRLLF